MGFDDLPPSADEPAVLPVPEPAVPPGGFGRADTVNTFVNDVISPRAIRRRTKPITTDRLRFIFDSLSFATARATM